MNNKSLLAFRERLDGNAGLVSKRRMLVTLSLLLLVIQFTGAVFKEANTFIFKIEFTNQSGLSVFLLLAVVVLMVRYYSYAHEYHQELFKLMAERMMSDYKIFRFNHHTEEISGLLRYGIDLFGGDEPGLQAAKYETDGFLKRKIVYQKEYHNEEGREFLDEDIPLNRYNEEWTRWSFFVLYWYESRYRLEALLKYRENLDLWGPYFLGSTAIIFTLIKLDVETIQNLWLAIKK
ncbi:hypothetical protein BCU68_03035 [Vibrio sp. 10N.286.49.B3]|uniref:hypothetical protein n=1 Tax=Vibrio sp. 10N.286.49.B3 TaxID=1880855 RepID=UPI000C82F551|nr:hypothetical protein [Vibrio sp. 10N.286.49.B3]PMH44492.1 hypothetical protein BCU68_03035 [Vibrio sp. 10N.286.49.B3]